LGKNIKNPNVNDVYKKANNFVASSGVRKVPITSLMEPIIDLLIPDQHNRKCYPEQKGRGFLFDVGLDQHGKGTLTWSALHNGAVEEYVGEWKDDKQHGQGTQTFSGSHKLAGEKYVGGHRDAKRHGKGTVTFNAPHKNAGEKYARDINYGLPGRKGTLTFRAPHKRAGEKYVGEVNRYGKEHGRGTLTYSDGERYVGGFKEGLHHGKGTITYPSGKILKGIWENNKFKSERK